MRRVPAVEMLVHFPIRGRDYAYGTVGMWIARIDTAGADGVFSMTFAEFAVKLTPSCERTGGATATAIVKRLLRGTELLVGHDSQDPTRPGP